MTKKIFLAWKLPKLPTGSDVALLVAQKVLTAGEARQMLFESRDMAKTGAQVTYTTPLGSSTVSSTLVTATNQPKNSEKDS